MVDGTTGGAANGTTVRTVLVVDDSAGDRTMVRRLLRPRPGDAARREYRLVEAATGAEGLAHCRALRPDCVLLDFRLPDMDGTEFLEALRRESRDAHVRDASGRDASGRDASVPDALPLPVALLTGQEDDRVALESLKRGAQDYLLKDALTAHGLVRAIENAIDRFQIRRELDEQRAAVEFRNHRLELLRDELQARMLELAEATKTKDRFLAVMSHEMRTPLNAVLGYADLLEMELEGALTDGQRQYVERIRVGGRHLLDLTNDVLDLTRADAGRLTVDLRPVDLHAVVEEVVALLEREAAAKGIALVAEPCGPGERRVQADLQRVRQILTNLVGNALKFTDAGSVRVRCLPPDASGRVGVEVVDTGIGIAPESLPLVFDEFYQVTGDLTRRHGGSGLGLAISRRLALLMGGDIAATSVAGVGSGFTLRLVAAPEAGALRSDDVAAHDARRAARAADAGRHDAPVVSVVAFGDDPATLAELERRVTPGVRLAGTTDADAVAALAAAERAALVVLDVGSADGAAWRVALAIQGAAGLAAPAVLLVPSLSAAMPDEGAEALDLGWVSLVPKPFTAAQLTTAISAATGAVGGGRDGGAPPPHDVLVVDDDPDSRRVAARFLAEAQVAVREAADGETALGEMRRHAPDVVVLDLMMPVLDGFGVLAAMRADPRLADIPVVVLTAKSLTDAERRFLHRTAAGVLQKGAHRLADVAALVLRAATRARHRDPSAAGGAR